MTRAGSSDCVREGSGRPTSAGTPGRKRNTGALVTYDVGRPHEECQETVAKQRKGAHRRTARVSRSRAAAAQRTAGAAAAKGDSSCGSDGGNLIDRTEAVTSLPRSLLHTEREETNK